MFQDDFDGVRVADVRRSLTERLLRAGFGGPRLDDFVTAINEAMTNAVRHGGGWGEVRLWRAEHLVCEVQDRGPGLADPLTVPKDRPRPSANGGMGLWLAQELADSIDIRSGSDGVRIRLTLTPAPDTDADAELA
ncbi:ATP-binding protein [Plantactinospora solaniradicis]|uniref:ATP-binding protein n=1 Tax=Plantactinospora solaniradicis TaxID=1723736 RepID=A0ABW1KNW1_9ACTN